MTKTETAKSENQRLKRQENRISNQKVRPALKPPVFCPAVISQIIRLFALDGHTVEVEGDEHYLCSTCTTRLRADYDITTPDALHLATARFHNCTELWTNDERLSEVANNLAVDVCQARDSSF